MCWQVVATVLSKGSAIDPEIAAINAASTALTCSNIPWGGPVAAVRVAFINNQMLVNPKPHQLERAELSVTYAGTTDRAVMVECVGQQVRDPRGCWNRKRRIWKVFRFDYH